MISTGKATLREMDEDLSVEDVYDLIEVALIDAHNQNVLNKRATR